MTNIKIVYHLPTGNTQKMDEAGAEGAKSIESVEVILKTAGDNTLEDR